MCRKLFTAIVPLTAFTFSFLALLFFIKPSVSEQISNSAKSHQDSLPVTDTEAAIFEAVEQEAYFPGGETGWRKFLELNLNPLVPVEKGAPPGTYTIFIQFVVSKDGTISAIKPLTKHGYGMEAEVMRIIRKSPSWVPAVQHGRNVNAYRKQPVTFQITEEKSSKKKKRS